MHRIVASLLPLFASGLVATSGSSAAASPASAKPAAPLTAEQVLTKALRSEEDLVYRGQADFNGESRVWVSHGAGRRQRQEIASPAEMAGDIVIDNGAMRWHLSRQARQVDVSPSEAAPLRLADRLALIKANYDLSLGGESRVAGQKTALLVLRNRHSHRTEHHLYVSVPGLPLQVEHWLNGRRLDYTRFLSIDWKPRLAKDAFEPHLPAGMAIKPAVSLLARGRDVADFRNQVNFRAQTPTVLPAGFRIVATRLFKAAGGEPTVHWQMTDGMSTASLFARRASTWRKPAEAETVALVPGTSANLIQDGTHTMFIWQTGGVRYTLVGVLAAETMKLTALSTLN